MKVRKEQFLLPKSKNTSPAKWIQPIRKPCDFSKTFACTPVSPQPSIEGLPSALLAKFNPDMLLSNGDIIVSGHTSGSLLWQQQDGILRQALLNTEKGMKLEETASEPINVDTCQNQNVLSGVTTNTGLVAITTVSPQQLTPIAASQVIKMNDYQVILSNDALSIPWQESRKKSNIQPISSLPPIKPKTDPGYVISEQQISFTSLGNVNVLSQNQFSTIFIKDGKTSLPSNPSINYEVNPIPMRKKTLSKSVTRSVKPRKKPTQAKQIMLKPTSSLLSQTALDYRNKTQDESRLEGVAETPHCTNKKSPTQGAEILYSNAEPVALVKNVFPSSTSSIILTAQECVQSLDSNLKSKSTLESNMSLVNFADKTGFPQSMPSANGSESDIVQYDSASEIMEHSERGSDILITSDSCTPNQEHIEQFDSTLNNSMQVSEGSVLIDSDTTVVCAEEQTPLLHADMLVQSDRTPDIVRSEGYHADHVETILPSDIEHHEEHHTQEYTDKLLSQLSDQGALPSMSSSQVSSVLNALAPSEKTGLSDMNAANNFKNLKEPVKCEPTEFVKIESTLVTNNIKIKTKGCEPKYRICELNKHTCFRCVNCMFLSLKAENVEKHWSEEHTLLRNELLDKQLVRRQIKCLGCTNIFYTKYALQTHLLCDHNVITTEIHDVIAATLAANKALREAKRQGAGKSANSKTKAVSQQTESVNVDSALVPTSASMSQVATGYQPGVTAASTQSLPAVTVPLSSPSLIVTMANVVMSEPTKVDEPKRDQGTDFPPTPSFSLFSEIQLNNGKEATAVTLNSYNDVENKKPVLEKPVHGLPRPKMIRSKTKSDMGPATIKFKYKCRVERCGVRLSNAVSMEHHLRCHKVESDMLYCTECDYAVNVLRCRVERCGVRLSNAVSMEHHLRCHKVESDMLYCTECDYASISWNSLSMHLWREHSIDVDLFSCKQCNYKTNSYSKLMNNHVKIHSSERPFLCDICGKGFKTTKQLRNHKGIHRAKSKFDNFVDIDMAFRKNTCNICGRTFADSRILKIHTENVHNKARPYLCTFCSHSASSKSSLRIHVRQHTGEKPFSCSECEYATSDHNSLRRHKMRHSGKRPYQCPHCPYTSIQATTYKAHLKNKHPGLDEGLMFSCPICPFRTIKRDNYLTHKAQHGLVAVDLFQNKQETPQSTSDVSQVCGHSNIEQFFEVDKHCEI